MEKQEGDFESLDLLGDLDSLDLLGDFGELDVEEEKELEIIIEGIDKAEIDQYGKDRFNSNNHWPNKKRPDDYEEVMESSVKTKKKKKIN